VTPKNMGGSSIGVLFGAQSLGASVGPLVGGLIADRFGLVALIANGYRALAWVLLAVYVLPLLTLGAWWLWRNPRQIAAAYP